jgi:hypothetical protein
MIGSDDMRPTFLAIALLAISGPALAQVVADMDGDGRYSLAELQVVYPGVTAADLAVIDANGDGAVDADELAAAEVVGTLSN